MHVDQANTAIRVTGLAVPWQDDVHHTGPAHQRLAALLRSEINTGRLRPGERLPPSRALAEQLGLSRWVVTEAYDQLKAEGYLTGLVGSGTRVAGSATGPDAAAASASATAASMGAASASRAKARSGEAAANPAPARSVVPPAEPQITLDLSPALPELSSFPRAAWRAATTRALDRVSDAQLGHPDPAGTPQLRRTLADYLRRVRALDLADDGSGVLITQGVGNAIDLICRQLATAGARRVAIENPSWPRLRQIVAGNGLDAVPIEVDREGLRVDALLRADAIERIDAVFTMPTHQFPTGVPLSAARRVALVQWAAAGDSWIIEDDYDAEFRYDRRPVGAVAALAPDNVAYLGSVSKTLSPSLHLGWMVAPSRLLARIASARAGLGALTPTIEQLALVDFITSGAYDRHLRRMRRRYQLRRRAMLEALHRQVPGAPAPSMDAGLHVLWHLPPGCDEATVIERCAASGIAVAGESACRVGPSPGNASAHPGLVLGYGNVPEHRADEIARIIAAATRA